MESLIQCPKHVISSFVVIQNFLRSGKNWPINFLAEQCRQLWFYVCWWVTFYICRKKRKANSSEDKSDNSSDSDNEFIALGKKGKGKNKKNQKKKDGTGKKRKRIKKVDSSDEGGEDSANETDADSDELEEMKNKVG